MSRLLDWRSMSVAAAALAATTLPLAAQQGADFYKGKTVTYIVATAPGGGYDTYGRLVAEYMQKYLPDRKSTRLNSSHANISYAVFCLKKKKKKHQHRHAKYKQIPIIAT